MAKGKAITSWSNLKNDVLNSGAKWKDDEIVVHKGIITTRCPNENEKFNRKMIEGFAIGPKLKRTLLH
jgi:protease I